MPGLHPPLSSFPVALFTVILLLEVIALRRNSLTIRAAVDVNLAFAVISVIAAFFSGYFAADSASQSFTVPDQAIAQHHNVGRMILFLQAPLAGFYLAWRFGTANVGVFLHLYRITLLLVVGATLYTGWLGGQLVFKHGAGVNVAPEAGLQLFPPNAD